MSPDVDVVVAGGGPVGLAAAVLATRAGLSACVVEHRADPVDKACGEGLMPPAVRARRKMWSARWPDDVQIFWPLITHWSPSSTARHWSEPRSDPEFGSE